MNGMENNALAPLAPSVATSAVFLPTADVILSFGISTAPGGARFTELPPPLSG